jgi:hypothetical protein
MSEEDKSWSEGREYGVVVNRLAAETSPYLLQPEAALATPTIRGRAGLAGATVQGVLQ